MNYGSAMTRRSLISIALSLLAACSYDPPVDSGESGIVNGVPVDEATFPGVGMLYDFDAGFLCTGSMIRDSIVLTAAHCVPEDGDLSSLRFTLDARATTQSTWIPVVDAKVQFLWSGAAPLPSRGDLAVLALGTDAPQPAYPRLLADESQLRPAAAGDPFDSMFVVGYGLNEELEPGVKRAGEVGFYQWLDDQGSPALTPGSFQEYAPFVDTLQLACPGDSGGPALLPAGDGLVIAGVTHAGTRTFGECSPDNRSIYTPVAEHRDWILAKADELEGHYGDLDGSGSIDVADLDAFGAALRAGQFDPVFDLDNDGDVDLDDGDIMVLDRVGILYGDIDANGVVDGADFLAWQRGTGKTTGRWSDGDSNFDGVTDGLDLDSWKRNYGDSADARFGAPSSAARE